MERYVIVNLDKCPAKNARGECRINYGECCTNYGECRIFYDCPLQEEDMNEVASKLIEKIEEAQGKLDSIRKRIKHFTADYTREELSENLRDLSFNEIEDEVWGVYSWLSDIRDIVREEEGDE